MPEEMPEPIEPISPEESLRLLREFLRQVEKLLSELAEYPRPAIPGRHHESMNAAWTVVRPTFKIAIDALQMPAASNIMARLDALGLIGPQLTFKLSVFHHARDELMDHGTPKEGQQRKRGWWTRLCRLLKPVLKTADVILDSLAKAIPVVEIIKEYKKLVESGVELGEVVDK